MCLIFDMSLKHDGIIAYLKTLEGEQFTDFKFYKEAGQSDVFLCRGSDQKEYVAKVSKFSKDDRRADMYSRQRMLLHVKGPGLPTIVAMYDPNKDDVTDPYIIQEFIKGSDLDEIIDNNLRPPFSNSELTLLLSQMLLNAQFYHTKNVVQRDIKIENYVIEEGSGLLYQVDTSALLSNPNSKDSRTIIESMILPPEAPQVDERSDLYLIGIVGMQCYIWKTLINEKREVEFDKKSSFWQYKDHKNPASRSMHLEKVLDKLTNPNPVERYQTAKEALDDLLGDRLVTGSTSIKPPRFKINELSVEDKILLLDFYDRFKSVVVPNHSGSSIMLYEYYTKNYQNILRGISALAFPGNIDPTEKTPLISLKNIIFGVVLGAAGYFVASHDYPEIAKSVWPITYTLGLFSAQWIRDAWKSDGNNAEARCIITNLVALLNTSKLLLKRVPNPSSYHFERSLRKIIKLSEEFLARFYPEAMQPTDEQEEDANIVLKLIEEGSENKGKTLESTQNSGFIIGSV